ncbi:hypothetical protein BGLA2_490034 [Burkholderia gladioli]|nr:hypothetical protein BGLA2_490034 [Burkholderia gladioli]
MHSGRKTPFARAAHLPRASRATGIFFRFAGRFTGFSRCDSSRRRRYPAYPADAGPRGSVIEFFDGNGRMIAPRQSTLTIRFNENR